MLPTLNGRIQTRVLVLGFLGLLVALVITPVLPTGDLSLGQAYRVTLSVLLATVLVGVLWELLYHFVQQFRWEKDWPTLFGLLTMINEGLLIYLLVRCTTMIVPEHLRPSLPPRWHRLPSPTRVRRRARTSPPTLRSPHRMTRRHPWSTASWRRSRWWPMRIRFRGRRTSSSP